jgi:Tol biopolymer transport system component
VTIADPVAFDGAATGAVSVSTAGLIAFRAGGASRHQLAWFDRTGKMLGTFGEADDAYLSTPRLSPDGKRVAVYRVVQGSADVWLLDGARMTRFTLNPALDRFPAWSPDGSRIAFDSNRKGQRNLYVKVTSGASGEELLLESSQDKSPSSWSSDGRFLLYGVSDPRTGWDLWIMRLDGDHKTWPFVNTSFNERGGQFSPDGRWIAYPSDESGRYEIYIRPFLDSAASSAGT